MFYAFQLLPGVKVVIANPDTKGQCADSHLGEVSPRLAEVPTLNYLNHSICYSYEESLFNILLVY